MKILALCTLAAVLATVAHADPAEQDPVIHDLVARNAERQKTFDREADAAKLRAAVRAERLATAEAARPQDDADDLKDYQESYKRHAESRSEMIAAKTFLIVGPLLTAGGYVLFKRSDDHGLPVAPTLMISFGGSTTLTGILEYFKAR